MRSDINLKTMLEASKNYNWLEVYNCVEKTTTQINRHAESIAHQAQIIHQAYHGNDNPKTWKQCTYDSCVNFRNMIAELKEIVGD